MDIMDILEDGSLYILLLQQRTIEEIKNGLTEELNYYKTALEHGDTTVKSFISDLKEDLEKTTKAYKITNFNMRKYLN